MVVVLFIAAASVQSCGYTLAGKTKNPAIPGNIRTIAIPFFNNQTSEPEIERPLTTATRKEFLVDGRFELGAEKSADAILLVDVVSYRLEPLSFDAFDNVMQYRVRLATDVRLIEASSKKVLLRHRLSADSTYDVSGAIANREIQRVEALKKASRQFSQELVNIIVEGF